MVEKKEEKPRNNIWTSEARQALGESERKRVGWMRILCFWEKRTLRKRRKQQSQLSCTQEDAVTWIRDRLWKRKLLNFFFSKCLRLVRRLESTGETHYESEPTNGETAVGDVWPSAQFFGGCIKGRPKRRKEGEREREKQSFLRPCSFRQAIEL